MTDKEKVREARARYMRAWRKKNPEKNKVIQERYLIKKYEEMEGADNE